MIIAPNNADGAIVSSHSNLSALDALSPEIRAVVRSYYNQFAWFAVIYQAVLLSTYSASIYLCVTGILPLWVGFVTSTVCAYYSLGPLHDAMHGNISGKGATLEEVPWFDTIFGWISSIPLIMPFSAYRMLHYRHHAHTNDPNADPDYYLAASTWWKSAFQALLRRLVLITTMIRRGPSPKLPPSPKIVRAKLVMVVINYASIGAIAASVYYGHFQEVFFLWYLPSKVATLVAEILTGWLPHYPFKETAQFAHSRIVRFWGSTILLFGHDYHALHHVFPRVPFHKYPEAFRRIGPELQKHGMRLEYLGASNIVTSADAR